MDHVRLASLTGDRAVLIPKPGARGVSSVVNEAHRERVAAELSRLVGRRVRVELMQQAGEAPHAAGPARAEGESSPATASRAGGGRDEVLSLPLVRDVLAVFPDAMVVEVGDGPRGDEDETGDET